VSERHWVILILYFARNEIDSRLFAPPRQTALAAMGNSPLLPRSEAYAYKQYSEGENKSSYAGLERFCPVIKKKKAAAEEEPITEKEGSDGATENSPKAEESKCPVMRKKGAAGTKYNVYSQPIDPSNQMPQNPNQLPRPGQSRPIDTARVKSSIPKGGTEEETWTYPSPQMFFNALNRKGKGDNVDENDVETVVAIHNNMNERTWKQVMDWEKTFHCDECKTPKLLKFIGRPDELSPKAKMRRMVTGEEPFDRHDWTIDRCGTQVRYIIDYYHDEENKEEEKVPHLRSSTDIKSITMVTRPAMDSIGSIFDRVRMPVFKRLGWDSESKFNQEAPVEKVTTKIASDKVYNTVQTIMKSCEKAAERSMSCTSEEECERAQLALDLCIGKAICPKVANAFGSDPCEEKYASMMECIDQFQQEATGMSGVVQE
jgi:cytochrome c heme-lyase